MKVTKNSDNVTVEAKYSLILMSPVRNLVEYTQQCNQQFLYTNNVKISQFKTKYSEIKSYLLCLGNISKDLIVHSMKKKKKTGLNGEV